MKINRTKFFAGFRDKIDSSIEQEQVDGLNFLLGEMENDSLWKDVRHIAYALATTGHETAWSFQPVEEGYYLGNAARVKRFQKTLRYYPYFGRGYVQLTWETRKIPNYSKASKALGVDFVKNPGLVMVKENAYKILTLGMHEGWFTTKKLKDYISGSKCDYKNARRIINGTDKAALIAGYAVQFEKILKDSAAPAQPQPTRSESAAIDSRDSNNAETATDQPPPIEAPPTPPEAEGQNIVSVPPVATTPPESLVSKAKGWYAAAPAAVFTFFGGVWSWIQGAATEIIIGLFVASAIIATVWIITNQWGKQRDKQREAEAAEKQKTRDHELTVLQLKSAMDKKLQTVRVSPPVVEIPAPEALTENQV